MFRKEDSYHLEVLENVKIYEKGRSFHLRDHNTGQKGYGKSLKGAYDDLLKANEKYKKNTKKDEQKEAERAADLIRDMTKHEQLAVTLLVGFISSDTNIRKEDIEINLEHMKWLKRGVPIVEKENMDGKRHELFERIKEMIDQGIDILERDITRVPLQRMIEHMLGRNYYTVQSEMNNYLEKQEKMAADDNASSDTLPEGNNY